MKIKIIDNMMLSWCTLNLENDSIKEEYDFLNNDLKISIKTKNFSSRINRLINHDMMGNNMTFCFNDKTRTGRLHTIRKQRYLNKHIIFTFLITLEDDYL